jgi:hypothetical protein
MAVGQRSGAYPYAYSAVAGRWHTLKLSEPLPTRGPAAEVHELVVQRDSAALAYRGRLYVFTAKSGRWQTITEAEEISEVRATDLPQP